MNPNEALNQTATDFITLEDGRRVDPETGEIVGFEPPAEFAILPEDELSEGYAHWILRKIAGADARAASALLAGEQARTAIRRMETEALAALRLTPEWMEHEAIVANADAIVTESERDRRWFLDRFRPGLESLVGTLGKGRSWKTPFGTVAMRRSPARLSVADVETAADHLQDLGIHDALRIETSVLVTKIPKDLREKMILGGAPGFEVTPARDDVAVVSGVGR